MSTFLKKHIRTERKKVRSSGNVNANTMAHNQAIRSVSSIWASNRLWVSAKKSVYWSIKSVLGPPPRTQILDEIDEAHRYVIVNDSYSTVITYQHGQLGDRLIPKWALYRTVTIGTNHTSVIAIRYIAHSQLGCHKEEGELRKNRS